MSHIFPAHDISRMLNIEATPSLFSALWHFVSGKGYESTLRQHTSDAEYRFSPDTPRTGKHLQEGASYYQVSNGLTGPFDTTIEFGIIHVIRNPVLPAYDSIRRAEAARVYITRARQGKVKVSISTGVATRAKASLLGLDGPTTREMTVKVLGVFGEAAGNIQHGYPVDFVALKDELQRYGLKTIGVADPALFPAAADARPRVA